MQANVSKCNGSSPLLFQKRTSVAEDVAVQYVGTDVEMDPKEAFVKPIIEYPVSEKR